MAVKGMDAMMRKLNREIAGIEGRTREGLQLAAMHVESESVPMAPVDTGNLRGSAFTDITAPKARPIVARVGYTAEYAAYVHEMVRKFDVGPQQDRSTAPLVGPRKPRGYTFVGPKRPGVKRAAGPKHVPWAPGTGPKFLQRAISENVAEVLNIIRQRAKIEGRSGA